MKLRYLINAVAVVTFTLTVASLSQAQATRTWVSGVGDDANPCSRTAPCKTFAGAISKTFIGGEIDALDPGGYGAVTITKSITIDGCCMTSILASGTNAVIVNIAPSANDPERRVTLRHLSINGTGSSGSVGQKTGLNGINFLQGNAVLVENCYIQNFTQNGISASLAAAGGVLSVKDTNITNCNQGIFAATSTGIVTVLTENVRIDRMASHGISLGGGGSAMISRSNVSKNGGDGLNISSGNTTGQVSTDTSVFSFNASAGVRAGGAGSTLIISNTSIMNNTLGPGSGGGTFISHGNNQISGNGTAGTSPAPVIGQQ